MRRMRKRLQSPGFRLTLTKLPGSRELLEQIADVSSMRVRSNRGDPCNELADVVCDTVSLRGLGFTGAGLPLAMTYLISAGGQTIHWLAFDVLFDERKQQYPVRGDDGFSTLPAQSGKGISIA